MPVPGNTLDLESAALTRYLAGTGPSDYIRRKYREGHAAIPYRLKGDEDAFDAMLVVVARGGTVRSRVADAYARIFRPHGALRQKLTLLLAILENSPDVHRRFTGGGRGTLAAIAGISASLFIFSISLLAGLLLLGPAHLLLRGRRPAARASA